MPEVDRQARKSAWGYEEECGMIKQTVQEGSECSVRRVWSIMGGVDLTGQRMKPEVTKQAIPASIRSWPFTASKHNLSFVLVEPFAPACDLIFFVGGVHYPSLRWCFYHLLMVLSLTVVVLPAYIIYTVLIYIIYTVLILSIQSVYIALSDIRTQCHGDTSLILCMINIQDAIEFRSVMKINSDGNI